MNNNITQDQQDTIDQKLNELDEFNKAYSLGIDVRKAYDANVNIYKYITPKSYIKQHEYALKMVAETVEGKLQYMYGSREYGIKQREYNRAMDTIHNLWKLEDGK